MDSEFCRGLRAATDTAGRQSQGFGLSSTPFRVTLMWSSFGGKIMKILIADALHPLAVNELESAGFRVTLEPKLKDSALVAALIETQPEVLIVRSTKVTEAMCSATDTLELIIRAGAGVNSIDLEAAARQAICVSNCPGMNATAVAELTFALILNDDRKLSKFAIANRQKSWQKKALGNARGLMGGRLGLFRFWRHCPTGRQESICVWDVCACVLAEPTRI